ncbi:MAG: hypothetical protein PXZ07_09210 [Candidatus Eremiobacteraeota bacterium]|nr:hypothetical protein [Candidatus Eremiobacteraeota bacterium]
MINAARWFVRFGRFCAIPIFLLTLCFLKCPIASADCPSSGSYFAAADAALDKIDTIPPRTAKAIQIRMRLAQNAMRALTSLQNEFGMREACPDIGELESLLSRESRLAVAIDNYDALRRYIKSPDCRELARLNSNSTIALAYKSAVSVENTGYPDENAIRHRGLVDIQNAAARAHLDLPDAHYYEPGTLKSPSNLQVKLFARREETAYQIFRATMTSSCHLTPQLKAPAFAIVIIFGPSQ